MRHPRLYVSLFAATVALALVAAGPASAHVKRITDPDDVASPLDISAKKQGHAGPNRITLTLTTFEPWGSELLVGENGFLVFFNTNGNPGNFERVAVIFFLEESGLTRARGTRVSSGTAGRLHAGILRRDGSFVGPVGVSRPNDRSVKITVRERHLGNPRRYGSNAASLFTDASGCAKGCDDHAPDGGWTNHSGLRN